MKEKIPHFVIIILLLSSIGLAGKDFSLKSPDLKLEIKIQVNKNVSWSLFYNGEELIRNSSFSLTLNSGLLPGNNAGDLTAKEKSIDEIITAAVPVKHSQITNRCNELSLISKNKYRIIFRAYNDGAAYRFELDDSEKELQIIAEKAEFNFAGNYRTFFPEEEASDFVSHYERVYKDTLIQSLADTSFCSLPVLFKTESGICMVVTEADLYDYPNMFLAATGTNTLKGIYPRVILEKHDVSDRDEEITKTAEYIAKIKEASKLPWRVIMVSENDGDLLENDLVYRLSRSNDGKDYSWVKPGKVAWDWWNALNVYGVDFKSGINTNTYKYYIDFAAKFGLEYIILDEGWSRTTHDLLHPTDDLDFKELFRYADSKNVGIILWVLWNALDKDMDRILDQFERWGAKGIKVDFMQRADQEMVNYYEKVAVKAAERKLLVDFHGAYKPSGLNRKYPNVLSFEGVKGLENNKWSNDITPKHDVTLPFTRMAAGPMDFTPGAMINAGKENFRAVFSQPMSQGTRAHQAAMYVVYESPLQMLSDNPSNYLKEPEYTKFIASMPTTWDETIGLQSEVGEYVVVARRKGDTWYLAAMTNWEPREIEIPLTFLNRNYTETYSLEYIQDGPNADKHASDYKITNKWVQRTEILKIKLAPGGGWAGIFEGIDHIHYLE